MLKIYNIRDKFNIFLKPRSLKFIKILQTTCFTVGDLNWREAIHLSVFNILIR